MADDSTLQAPSAPSVDYAESWLRCQREAERWVAPEGALFEDVAVRNRRISAAYATLWLADRRFQWAGLAAFASSQVGCDMADAASTAQDAASRIASGAGVLDWLYRNAQPLATGLAATFMRGQLASGNLAVFLDVYPLHRFFMLHGAAALCRHLAERKLLASRVLWPAGCAAVPFGQPFKEIGEAFTLMEQGAIEASVIRLAWHEQVNILQPLIYDDPKTRLVLDANQMAWAMRLPHTAFEEIVLPFASQCGTPARDAVPFSQRADAHLYDPHERMAFVARAATQFDALLRGRKRLAVELALRELLARAC